MKLHKPATFGVVGLALFLTGLSLMVSDYFLTSYLLSHGYQVPLDSHVHYVEIKGKALYLSEVERFAHTWTSKIGFLLLVVGIILRVRAKSFD